MAYNFTDEQVLEACRKSAGVVSCVAAELGCSWICADTYIKKTEGAPEVMEHGRAVLHRVATGSLARACRDGERWAVERILDTSARKDGFGIINRSQIDHTTDGDRIEAIRIEFIDPPERPALPDHASAVEVDVDGEKAAAELSHREKKKAQAE